MTAGRSSRTQTTRVLAALRRAGADGISVVDFLPPTIDGGLPVTRLAARVADLRAAGHEIATRRSRSGVAVYVLELPAERISVAAPSAMALPVDGRRAPRSPYEVDG